jgi:hypothetical protein
MGENRWPCHVEPRLESTPKCVCLWRAMGISVHRRRTSLVSGAHTTLISLLSSQGPDREYCPMRRISYMDPVVWLSEPRYNDGFVVRVCRRHRRKSHYMPWLYSRRSPQRVDRCVQMNATARVTSRILLLGATLKYTQ